MRMLICPNIFPTIALALISFSAVSFGTPLSVAAQEQGDHPGIVMEKPANGQFVELPDGGFMVPFETTIPGSDVTFQMVPIPGGKVKVGSPDSEGNRMDCEGPQVELEIKPIWIGQHEVTWSEYKVYMRLDTIFKKFNTEGIRQITEETEIDAITAPSGLYDPSFTYDAGDGLKQPAATMTQFAAKQYTKWLSRISGQFFRLPSEGEWEYACRAGTTTAYYFGDDPSELEEHAWFDDNADWERQDVGQLKPNPWGLYDMYGNVSEWVLDGYSEEGFGKLKEAKDMDPLVAWPTEVYPMVSKGGHYLSLSEECRSASRLPSDDEDWKIDDPNTPQSPWWYTTEPATGVGFRLVMPLHVPESREAQEKFWEAGHEDIDWTVEKRIITNGKGSFGIADPSLPEAILGDGKKK